MITLLLTLHTATTATLLVSQSTLNNTKQPLQSIFATQSQQTAHLNLILNAGTASFQKLSFFCTFFKFFFFFNNGKVTDRQ